MVTCCFQRCIKLNSCESVFNCSKAEKGFGFLTSWQFAILGQAPPRLLYEFSLWIVWWGSSSKAESQRRELKLILHRGNERQLSHRDTLHFRGGSIFIELQRSCNGHFAGSAAALDIFLEKLLQKLKLLNPVEYWTVDVCLSEQGKGLKWRVWCGLRFIEMITVVLDEVDFQDKFFLNKRTEHAWNSLERSAWSKILSALWRKRETGQLDCMSLTSIGVTIASCGTWLQKAKYLFRRMKGVKLWFLFFRAFESKTEKNGMLSNDW